MYHPQISWLPDKGGYPYQGYQNQKQKIDKFNTENNVVKYPAAMLTDGCKLYTICTKKIYGSLLMKKVKLHWWNTSKSIRRKICCTLKATAGARWSLPSTTTSPGTPILPATLLLLLDSASTWLLCPTTLCYLIRD